MTGAAVAIGAGVVTAGAAVYGAVQSGKAASNAANAQIGASQNANATQLAMYNQSRADQAPWRAAGGQAVNALSQWYGLGGINQPSSADPNAPSAAPGYSTGGNPTPGGVGGWNGGTAGGGYGSTTPGGGLYSAGGRVGGGMDRTIQPVTGPAPRPGTGQQPIDYQKLLSSLPGYQFQLSQGENAVNSNLAARGLLQSGAAGKALTQYGQGVASDYATQYINGLQSLAGLGQTSAANTGALGANAANQIGSNQLYAGNAQASGYVGQANAINSGLSGLAGVYGQYRTQQNQLYNQQYDQLQPIYPNIPYAQDPYANSTYGGGPG